MEPDSQTLPVDRKAISDYNSHKVQPLLWSTEPAALMRSLLRYTGKALSLELVARRSGLCKVTVKETLTGVSRPYLWTGLKLARALEIPPTILADALLQARKNHMVLRKELQRQGLWPTSSHPWPKPARRRASASSRSSAPPGR